MPTNETKTAIRKERRRFVVAFATAPVEPVELHDEAWSFSFQ